MANGADGWSTASVGRWMNAPRAGWARCGSGTGPSRWTRTGTPTRTRGWWTRRCAPAVRVGLPSVLAPSPLGRPEPVSYTHLRAHETDSYLVCRLLLEKKKGP